MEVVVVVVVSVVMVVMMMVAVVGRCSGGYTSEYLCPDWREGDDLISSYISV